jgi:hypothetical protein
MTLDAYDVRAFLAQRSLGRLDEQRPPDQLRAYREAASVLIAVKNLEELRPCDGPTADGPVIELLGPDLMPATGRRFHGTVMMEPAIRVEAVQRLVAEDRLGDALAANPDERVGDPFQAHFESYLLGDPPPLGEQTLPQLDATRQVALWFGGRLNGVPRQDEVEARAAYLRLIAPLEAIGGEAVFRGRAAELHTLRTFVGNTGSPAVALSISGPGGVGKSALAARLLLERTRPPAGEDLAPFGYLDFDRADLDIGDPLTLCWELLRQLDIQYPGDDRFAGLRERGERHRPRRSADPPAARLAIARDLLRDVLDRLVQVHGPRPYVIVLDTFEIVQLRGTSRGFPLWELLAGLRRQAPFLRVIVAGRAAVESFEVVGGPVEQLTLGDLDDESAEAFLRVRGIDGDGQARRLVETFGRMPLTLKLVAELAARTPGGAGALLEEGIVAASDEVIQGQLYERVLDHIDDPQVKRLAYPGLVLRRINPEVVLEVLNEPCGLGLQSIEESADLCDRLRQDSTLVYVDAAEGDLVHRSDLRRVMLKMLLISAPARVDRIRRAAIDYYERQPSRRGRAEECYHRLHLNSWADPSFFSDTEVRSSIQAVIEEFTPQVMLYLSTFGLKVPSWVAGKASRAERDAAVAAEIEELLPYGPSSESQAWTDFDHARAGTTHGSPVLCRAGARVAAQRGQDALALSLIDEGLETAVRNGSAAGMLPLLQERAWLRKAPTDLDRLAEHARRHDDTGAQLQHRLQTGPFSDRDLAVIGELLTQADSEVLWGLVPAMREVVEAAAGRGATAVLGPLEEDFHDELGPFRYAVFHDAAVTETLELLLSGRVSFAPAFLDLCRLWPYRILFVRPPYGRRGEQLSESVA